MTGPGEAVAAHDAYWRLKEVGEPPAFDSIPLKLQQCWEAAAAAVVAAERQRLKGELLGCITCGNIHSPRAITDSEGSHVRTTWAAPDGHSYSARFLSHSSALRDYLAALLDAPAKETP